MYLAELILLISRETKSGLHCSWNGCPLCSLYGPSSRSYLDRVVNDSTRRAQASVVGFVCIRSVMLLRILRAMLWLTFAGLPRPYLASRVLSKGQKPMSAWCETSTTRHHGIHPPILSRRQKTARWNLSPSFHIKS